MHPISPHGLLQLAPIACAHQGPMQPSMRDGCGPQSLGIGPWHPKQQFLTGILGEF